MKANFFQDRTIATHQLMMAMNCLHGALAAPEAVRRSADARSESDVKQDIRAIAAHKLISGMQPDEILPLVHNRAPELDDDKVMRLIADAQRVANRNKQYRKKDADVIRDKVIIWTDNRSGWSISAKPGLIEPCGDEHGEFVQITNLRFPKVVRERHIEAVRLHGLVCYMLLHEAGEKNIRIKLVVDCMGSRDSHTEWMDSELMVSQLLERVRDALGRLEDEAAQPDRVPSRTVGGHCFGCSLRDVCRQGGKFIRREEEALEAQRLVRKAANDSGSGRGRKSHFRHRAAA